MNTWALALKEYNKDKAKWTIPKKGTKEYNAVKALQSKNLKGSGAKQSRPAPPEDAPIIMLKRPFKADRGRAVTAIKLWQDEGQIFGDILREGDPKVPQRPILTESEPEIIDIQPSRRTLKTPRKLTESETTIIDIQPSRQTVEKGTQKTPRRLTESETKIIDIQPSRRTVEKGTTPMTPRPKSSASLDIEAMSSPPISSIIKKPARKWEPAQPWNSKIYVPKI